MIAFSTEERLALLLSVLGDEIAEGAFGSMEANQSQELKRLYREFKTDPPSSEEIEYVIGDFLKFFDFAAEALGLQANSAADKDQTQAGAGAVTDVEPQRFPEFKASSDPVQDLNRLDPYQVCKAIDTDHPKTIALVLRSINVKQAAQVLELLGADIRGSVVSHLTVGSTVPAPIVNQVLKTTVERAREIRFRPIEVEQAKVIADLMRSLSKALRIELMKQLAESNGALAEQVKSQLYLFTDVLRLNDRDTQKLLSQLETDSLIVGLQRCEPAITDKLLNNLSKRAKETIIEEMEFKKEVSDQEIQEARAKILQVICTLDESGEIKL